MRREVERAYARYGPMVLRRARRILGDQTAAEDVAQDVFIKAYRSGGFDVSGEVSSWLYRITTNLCLNRIRDERRREELRTEHYGNQPHVATDMSAEHRVLLHRLLRDVDERQAQAAVYVFVDGMSYAEAAPLLGVSKRTVGNLVERFRDATRKNLEATEREGSEE